jgi:hypothetical protein
MGRIRPAWYYQRQAAEAQARETHFLNRTPPPAGTTVNQRGDTTQLFYRSLSLVDGTDPLIFRTDVRTATLGIVSAAQAGLKTTLANTEAALPLRGSGLVPTKLQWYKGDATPSVQRTAWNTHWTRYYQTNTHHSMPFSRATGSFTAHDLTTAFNALFGATGTVRDGALGTKNGRANLTLERAPISANT